MNAALDNYEEAKAKFDTKLTLGQRWWLTTTNTEKVKLMKEMGFGDYRVYARYRWEDFAPHTREEIDRIISNRSQ